MNKVAIWSILLGILAAAADGATDSRASTNSYLISYDTISSSARTISQNFVSTSDLTFLSEGQVDGTIRMESPSTSMIKQDLHFTGLRNGGYGGSSAFSSSIAAENVISADSLIMGRAQATVSRPIDFTKVDSETFGMTLANPGSDDYHLFVEGTQRTKTTAPLFPYIENPTIIREFKINFDLYSLELESAADFFAQDVEVDYQIANNEISAYSYDFLREMNVEDISFKAEMSFVQL